MRIIKKIHRAVSSPIADLVTYRALPVPSVPHIDPFLFLNHHGHQIYPRNNRGLPFGPHPHRGFATVTFILEGDLAHKDNSGAAYVVGAGGVQWMTAGRGLIHAEVSSEEFKLEGGPLEILQLWVNLPAKHKMIEPSYVGLAQHDIPKVSLENGQVEINAVSGSWHGTNGAFNPLTDIALATISLKKSAVYQTAIPAGKNVFFYTIKGSLKVNGKEVEKHDLVEFSPEGKLLQIEALSDSLILFGHATPFNEPIIAHGPFVMNTMDEIHQAYDDYNQGLFGTWNV